MRNHFENLPFHVPDAVRAKEDIDRSKSSGWQEEWCPTSGFGSEKTKHSLLTHLGELNGEDYVLYPQMLTTYFSDIESQKARLYVLSSIYQRVIRGMRGARIVMMTALFDRQIFDFFNDSDEEYSIPRVRLPREEIYRRIEEGGTEDMESYCQIFFCTAKKAGEEVSHYWVMDFVRKVNESLSGMDLPLLPEPGGEKMVISN